MAGMRTLDNWWLAASLAAIAGGTLFAVLATVNGFLGVAVMLVGLFCLLGWLEREL